MDINYTRRKQICETLKQYYAEREEIERLDEHTRRLEKECETTESKYDPIISAIEEIADNEPKTEELPNGTG